MVHLYQFERAPAFVPLRLEADPYIKGCERIASRVGHLVDEQSPDRIAQIRAENVLFKRDIERTLIVQYGEHIGVRAIAAASSQRASADLKNSDDIFKEDVDLIVSFANRFHNTPMVEEFLKLSNRSDFAASVRPGDPQNAMRFDTTFVEMVRLEAFSEKKYLWLEDAHNPMLVSYAKSQLLDPSFLKMVRLTRDGLCAYAVLAVEKFAMKRKKWIYKLWLINDLLPRELVRHILVSPLRRRFPAPASPTEF